MRVLVAVLTAAVAAPLAESHDHQGCPMAKKEGRHQAEVEERHQHTTGVPTDGTRHRFTLTKDGGSIRLSVEAPDQTASRDRIREHLQEISRSFSAGDFSMPTRIHDRLPPGAAAMKAHGGAIHYVYSERPDGGDVTIRTQDAAALAAVHEFLRFQILDHGTGDPTE